MINNTDTDYRGGHTVPPKDNYTEIQPTYLGLILVLLESYAQRPTDDMTAEQISEMRKTKKSTARVFLEIAELADIANEAAQWVQHNLPGSALNDNVRPPWLRKMAALAERRKEGKS